MYYIHMYVDIYIYIYIYIYIKPSCAKIIFQIRPFGQAQLVYAVSHVVIKNIVAEYTETTPLQINLYFFPV